MPPSTITAPVRFRSLISASLIHGTVKFENHQAIVHDQAVADAMLKHPLCGSEYICEDELDAARVAASEIVAPDPGDTKPADELPDEPPAETGTKADGDDQDDEPADRPADSKTGKGKRGKGG